MATIEELEERLSTLESKFEEQKKRRTLRGSLQCPNCDNTEIFLVSPLDTYQLPLRIAQEGVLKTKFIGALELYLCSQCGYGEAQLDPSQLKEKERKNVKLVSNANEEPTPEEPYR
jgi:ssDNA-binding Zn-finger/Zn-ribbon topoisomerase 1